VVVDCNLLPTDDVRKKVFIEQLHNLTTALGGPWEISGDFSFILDALD
jgi:hypothetical protein